VSLHGILRRPNAWNPVRAQVVRRLEDVVADYRRRIDVNFTAHIPRISFEISLALNALNKSDLSGCSVCDIGAGVGLFTVGCAALGAKLVILLDDFGDGPLSEIDRRVLETHRTYGVEVAQRDILSAGLRDLGTFDVVTSFASMEHWNRAPRRVFQQISTQLRSGGAFVLGTPNCVNLRKRITVPFGVGSWTPLKDWYEAEVFRGHVREPDVRDLAYIAADMNLKNISIYGRNWIGYGSRYRFARIGTKFFGGILQTFPSLCSDIYVTGNK
jgi:2-polyprenyl-3-methyl-5-hydroxy-6-metoxy-1,4-benzoquinol methylase